MCRLRNVCATFLLFCGNGLFVRAPCMSDILKSLRNCLISTRKPDKEFYFSSPAVLSDFWLSMDHNAQRTNWKDQLVTLFLAESDSSLFCFYSLEEWQSRIASQKEIDHSNINCSCGRINDEKKDTSYSSSLDETIGEDGPTDPYGSSLVKI